MQRFYQWTLQQQWYTKILYKTTSSLLFSPPKAMEGAVAIVSAKDIPQNGKNDFMLGLAGDPEMV